MTDHQPPTSSAHTHAAAPAASPPMRVRSDIPFLASFSLLGGVYVLLILGLIFALASFGMRSNPNLAAEDVPSLFGYKLPFLGYLWSTISSPRIAYSIRLSIISCTITAVLSLWVAVPLGYLLSRHRFPGRNLLDAILDIPIVLPPLVIGLALLIFFQSPAAIGIENLFIALEAWLRESTGQAWIDLTPEVTYAIPAVILAQFMVAAAFAIRTMRVTFDQINPRPESVALTLGASRSQAFWLVLLPQARRGMLSAAILAWARSLGEFGPILIFAGATRMRTEVLPTSVFLELSQGDIESAAAVSLIMVAIALLILLTARFLGLWQRTA